MGEVLEARRSETTSRFEQLQKRLKDAEELAAGKACVYATGSFGRGEASKHSDLDLFIVGRLDKDRRAKAVCSWCRRERRALPPRACPAFRRERTGRRRARDDSGPMRERRICHKKTPRDFFRRLLRAETIAE